VKLRDMGDLRTGYQLRGALDPVPEGPHRVVFLGDLQEEGIDWSRVARAHLARVQDDDFLVFGDIIIRSRGAHYGAVLVTDSPDKTVVAAPLYILSICRPDVLPPYVAWYLNRPATRTMLENMARGTSLPTISIQDLREMEIPIPSLETQHAMNEVAILLQRERELSKRLIELRKQLADQLLEGMAQGKVHKKTPIPETPSKIEKPTRSIRFAADED
jgi:hypothetical protein